MTKETQDIKMWQTQEINRAQIKNAPYNPRFITEKARKKLKANLLKHGLMGGIVWNKRTGNLVSGHQRISIIDAVKGKDNYTIPVTVVDFDLETEKTQNIALNNRELQGDYDADKLKALLKEVDTLSIPDTGFIETDVLQMFGENIYNTDTEQYKEACARAEKAKELFDIINKIQNTRADNFYVVLVWKEAKERAAFLADLGFEDNKFMAAPDFLRALRNKYSNSQTALGK